ncbi:AAA family ATPase [Dictyobacter arantiisoli]|uniref:Magnesium chelatase n=1 Tax=Dictyobacter arantiisoli TaxID=2014874 RepID=A0A5A5TDI3_9CHLR|nr:AAA family ATPase [Dictyobacter arantiisoli]GCF09601.1 magnesium chelatase [Dictyobacter arantiisoli]
MDKSSDNILRTILPYTEIVEQRELKMALELAYIAPRIGGVLISGQRGTAKSTTVRAFASMMYDKLPVTIPINATEDRVVGGWKIYKLMEESKLEKQAGLIEEADGSMLYIDEVNLLDDHIINILLDVTSTGKLIIQREGRQDGRDVHMILVGTMNPEEGNLRPQLLDRFGLMVQITSLTGRDTRRDILKTVLAFDRALLEEEQNGTSRYLENAHKNAQDYKAFLKEARDRLPQVTIPEEIIDICAMLTEKLEVVGHRADYLLAVAAQAHAARERHMTTTREDVLKVAELVLRHRIANSDQLDSAAWNEEHRKSIVEIVGQVEHIEHASK